MHCPVRQFGASEAVARRNSEYGIPAVVCTGDATRRLADGQLVTVSGRRASSRRTGEIWGDNKGKGR